MNNDNIPTDAGRQSLVLGAVIYGMLSTENPSIAIVAVANALAQLCVMHFKPEHHGYVIEEVRRHAADLIPTFERRERIEALREEESS